MRYSVVRINVSSLVQRILSVQKANQKDKALRGAESKPQSGFIRAEFPEPKWYRMAGTPKKGEGKTHGGMRIEYGVSVCDEPTYGNSPTSDDLNDSQARGCVFKDF